MLQSPAILIGGIFALLELVVAALLDFFKRDRRRYDMLSRSASVRMFRAFLAVTLIEWTILVAMQFVFLPPTLGWPAFAICFMVKVALLQRDFARRRTDVSNVILRIAQYQFLAAAVALMGISYYVHSRPKPPPSTAPASASGPGIRNNDNSAGGDFLND